jgi:hypothetical protein
VTRRVASSTRSLARTEGTQGSRDLGDVRRVPDMHLDHVPTGLPLDLGRRAVRDGLAAVDDHDVVGEVVGLVQVLRC